MKRSFLAALMQRRFLRVAIVASLCIVALYSALVLVKPATSAHAQSSPTLAISAETIVRNHSTLSSQGLGSWNDDTLGCLPTGNGNIDCYGSSSGASLTQETTKTSGTTSDPAQTVDYTSLAITNLPSGIFSYANVGPVYKDSSSGTLLGMVHLERWPSNNWQYFWASVGLVYSKDNGATWDWGGEIIQHNIPYSASATTGYEAGNGAYILYTDNGTQYLYVYMDDDNANGSSGVSVSRAPLQQVLNAVNNGTALPTFYKYDNGGWSSQAAWINGTNGTPQGGPFSDVSGQNGAFDSIIWDGALNQYVAGVRGYDQNYWTVDLVTSANPLDFSVADGATRYEITNPNQAVYPAFVGDPNKPELQANADGSFYVYYTTWPSSHDLNYSDTSLGRRLITLNTTGTSNQASNNFSSNQGQGQWSYEQSNDGEQSFQAMNWDSSNSRWQGSDTFCLVGNNWQHPGSSTCDSARVWTAPTAGSVSLSANGPITVAASCDGNTSGVNLRVLKNGSQIWPASGWQNIGNGGSFSFPAGVSTTVSPGDQLQFVVAHAGSVNSCDTTTWDQLVTYGAQASTGFSSNQGQSQWSYQQSNDGEQSFQAMNWDSTNLRWQGSDAFCLVGVNWQHPGSSTCDSVRVWTASASGTAVLGASSAIVVAASCNGNTSGVNIRVLKNGSQIWPASGWQNIGNGGSFAFPAGVSTTVSSGDQIQFVVAHAGSGNSCDTTTWDQTVSVSQG